MRLKVNPYTGWVSIHEDSCRRCTQPQIEEWLVTCPRCAAGEGVSKHPDHDAPDLWCLFVKECGDLSPVACVVEAMWQFLNGEELLDDAKALDDVESTKQWLDSLRKDDGTPLVPDSLGQSAAWDLVKSIPGCPTQALLQKAQAGRKAKDGAS